MPNFIGTAALQSIADKFAPQIIMGAAHFRPDVFTRMRIKVETGVQYQSTKTILLRKGHTAQKKVVGESIESTVGFMVERKCITSLAWDRYLDNKDKYRENKQFDVKDNTKFNYPMSELAVMAIIANYGENIFDCLWHGDESISKDDAKKKYLRVMDGFITYLNHDIEKGYINEAFNNYVHTEKIDAPVDKDDIAAYNEFVKFRSGWHQNLRNAPLVLVYCSEETGAAVARAYKNANGGYEGVRYLEDDTYKFAEWRNIIMVPESSFGKGDKMIATVPDNFEYCVDSLDSRNSVTVQAGSDKDNMDIYFQVQSIQGTRVLNIASSYFCMSDGSLAPNDVAGDYTEDIFVVSSNDETLGKVTVNGSAPDNTVGYASGTTLNLVATAESGGKFVSWSDGNTEATRAVITKGQPAGLMAIFAKSEEVTGGSSD